MADSKLSQLTNQLTSFAANTRVYLSDGADKYAEMSDFLSLTGDVTCDQTRVTSLGAGLFRYDVKLP